MERGASFGLVYFCATKKGINSALHATRLGKFGQCSKPL
jgi:hypothetical protein